MASIIDPFVSIVSSIIAFAVIFIVAKIVLGIAFALIDKIFSAGIIGALNRVLGAAVMFVFAALVAWGVVSILDLVLHTPAFVDKAWVQEFSGGAIYNFLKSISPLEILLSF